MIPEKLDLSNFLSHADSRLDLSGIGMAIITGPNGHGKSAIIDAVTYALFGKGRADSPDGLVRLGQTDMRVELTFDLGGQTYRVSRSRTLSGGGKTVLLYDILDTSDVKDVKVPKWRTLAGASIAETQAKIESTLSMDYRTLVNSSVLLQGDADEFSRQSPANRKQVLGRILSLDIYDEAAARTREKGRALRASLEGARTLIQSREQELTSRPAIESGVTEGKAEVEQVDRTIGALETTLGSLRAEQAKLTAAAVRLDALRAQEIETIRDRDQLDADIETLQHRQSGLKQRLAREDEIKGKAERFRVAETAFNEIDELGRTVSALALRKSELEKAGQALERQREQVVAEAEKTYQAKKTGLEHERDTVAHQIEVLTSQAEKLDGLPCAEMEIQANCRLLTAALEAREMLPEAEQNLVEIESSLADLSTSPEMEGYGKALEAREQANPHYEEAAKLEGEINALGYDTRRHAETKQEVESLRPYADQLSELLVSRTELTAVDQSISDTHARAGALGTKLAGLWEQIRDLSPLAKKGEEISAMVGERERELTALRRRLSESSTALASLEEQLRRLHRVAAEINQAKSESADQEARISLLAEVAEMLGKNGVQAMLIERGIPAIEDEANLLLGRLTDGLTLTLETQAEKKSGGIAETLDIVLSDDQGRRAYECYSGGEKFRVDFALRIALAKLLAHRAGAKLETLIIDEGFGTQDAEGLARLLECLQVVAADFRLILVISHIEEMKDAFPHQFAVSKNGGESRVAVLS